MPDTSCTLRLQPALDELPRLVAFIETFGEQHDVGPGDIFSITLAAEELFANTLRHSQPPATAVEVTLSLDSGLLRVLYCDDGAPFDPTQQAAADTTLPAEDRTIGGLGIQIIRRTMQDFAYERAGGYNRTAFSRRLPA